MYTVNAKDGTQRPTTLRDARKLGLVPSVTTILNIAAKPGLTAWKERQLLLAALTLPRLENEPEDQFIDRIFHDSREQGKQAAQHGTDIHAAIQGFFEGTLTTAFAEHITGFNLKMNDYFGDHDWIPERPFCHELGFGGKCDLFTNVANGIVIDIKTKDFDTDKVEPFDEHLMQLSAYRVGLGLPQGRCANVFVSRTVPGLTVIHEWTQKDLSRGWEMFISLLNFWQAKTGHK
jgi:hypothetical protein